MNPGGKLSVKFMACKVIPFVFVTVIVYMTSEPGVISEGPDFTTVIPVVGFVVHCPFAQMSVQFCLSIDCDEFEQKLLVDPGLLQVNVRKS